MRSKTGSRQCNRPGGIALGFSRAILGAQERTLHAILFASHTLECLGKAMARGVIGIGAAVGARDSGPQATVLIITLHRIAAHANLGSSSDGSAGKRNVNSVAAGLGKSNSVALEIIAVTCTGSLCHRERCKTQKCNNSQNACHKTFHNNTPFSIKTVWHKSGVQIIHRYHSICSTNCRILSTEISPAST